MICGNRGHLQLHISCYLLVLKLPAVPRFMDPDLPQPEAELLSLKVRLAHFIQIVSLFLASKRMKVYNQQ